MFSKCTTHSAALGLGGLALMAATTFACNPDTVGQASKTHDGSASSPTVQSDRTNEHAHEADGPHDKSHDADAHDAHSDTHADNGAAVSDFTLKQVMQPLGASQNQLHLGLLSNNRLMIGKGAHAIAHHPMPKGGLKPYIKKNQKALMPTIKAMDTIVHDTAIELAKKADTAPLADLQKLNDRMVQGCISCHHMFRD